MFRTKTQATWTIASVALLDAYTDFMLSRQAMNCTPATLAFYKHTAGAFLSWIENQNVTSPEEVTARHVRQFIAGLADQGRKDTTLHANARAIRTLLRFWHAEGYINQPVKFDMPKLEKKRLPVLTAEQLQQVVSACNVRDKALVLFLSDSGVRREEAIKLNWGSVDIQTGRVTVKHGKGGKDRTAAIGATTRRALLKYRRTLKDVSDSAPLFQTQTGLRLGYDGFVQIFHRLTEKTGIYISPHALRRTWTILCLRAGMDALHIQHLGGWEDLTMVDHYAQMEDEDLLKAHKAHSPIDNLLKK